MLKVDIDKDASMKAIEAGERTFERFGSTRLLGFGMLVIGVWMVVGSTEKPSEELLLWGLATVAAGFGLLVVSYVFRPHDAKKSKPEVKP